MPPLLPGEDGEEFAGGEGFKGAEASFEFGASYAPLAVEPTEKIARSLLALLRIALQAAGNEIAIGIASGANTGNDVVQAHPQSGEPLPAIKAQAGFAGVNGTSQLAALQEIGLLQAQARGKMVCAGRFQPRGPQSANLIRQSHFHQVAYNAALHQPEHAVSNQPADGIAHRRGGKADTAA